MTLRDALVRRGIPWSQSNGSEISLNCPFCAERGESPDRRKRFCINLESGFAICFNCNFRTRHGFAALFRKLQFEGSFETDKPAAAPTQRPHFPEDFQLLKKPEGELENMAYQYLLNRGISQEQIARKRIGISLTGRYAYRVLFPVWYEKKLNGLIGRDFTGQQEPRYLNSVGEKGLYNYQPSERVILSEGVFKALRIERLDTGFRSMAVLGRSITELQLKQLKAGGCKEVVIWPDPDKPGREGAVSIMEKLQDEGFLVGLVWPVFQSADEESLDSMESTWTSIEGYSWSLSLRVRAREAQKNLKGIN